MKKIIFYAINFISVGLTSQTSLLNLKAEKSSRFIYFTENKGQVCDQYYQSNNDVLYSGANEEMTFHLKRTGVSYQLARVDSWKKTENNLYEKKTLSKKSESIPKQITIYRLDINWLDANTNSSIKENIPLDGFTNYYLENCPNGLFNVKNYKEIIFQHIYLGIDLKWYQKDGNLKYDYMVAAGADYKKIRLEINGAKKINLNSAGELLIKTPLGIIKEKAPLVLQNGKILTANWIIKGNVVSFNIEGVDSTKPFIIDPTVAVRLWGTFYGGNNEDFGWSCATDKTGNVYLAGFSATMGGNSIATVGSHQTVFSNGLGTDAYIAKFNSQGVRLWGTYYGGTDEDRGFSCATDLDSNVYLCGKAGTNSATVMATNSSQQPIHGGGTTDAFLVKFNYAGVRQWGTYYGGSDLDEAYCCATDINGNVYLTGFTQNTVSAIIATPGSYQSVINGVNNAFLVKFDSNGVRQWGTYYGDTGGGIGYSCATDNVGNVYLAGITGSNSNSSIIATPGSHQPTSGGSADAFLVKFNSVGVRMWGTFYGDLSFDQGSSCATDLLGNVYLAGLTWSSTGTAIATPGCHQPLFGGNFDDSFLAKFDTLGVRQWGTYYGGAGIDEANYCTADSSGNVYLCGTTDTNSGNAIATAGSHQSQYGGGVGYDAFIAKFNPTGTREWGTYYGSALDEWGGACAIGNNNDVYMAGYLAFGLPGTLIATANSHQTAGGGLKDGFLVKFSNCSVSSTATNNTSPFNQIICANNTTTLSAIGQGIINWYVSTTSTLSLYSGTTYVTPPLSAGTYSFYAEDFTCAPSISRAEIIVTVDALPSITVNSGSICSGQSFTIYPSGASTYTISGGLFTVNPSSNASYSVYGTSTLGCVSISPGISTVVINPLPSLIITSSDSVLCANEAMTLNVIGASTYTWNTGSNNSFEILTPTVTTTYSVIGTDSNSCKNSAAFTQLVDACLGLEKKFTTETSLVKIYPNPSKGNITIELKEPSSFSIYNSLGQTIYKQKDVISISEVSLLKFPTGIYYLKLINNTSSAFKIIKID